jgi:hypothetical protein
MKTLENHELQDGLIVAANGRLSMPSFPGHDIPSGMIVAANESRFTESNYSEPLTNYVVGWKDPLNLQALTDFLAPPVPVGRRFEFKSGVNAEYFLADSDDVRAIGAPFKRVEYSGTSVNAKTLNKGLTLRIDHDDQLGDDWMFRAVDRLNQRLDRNELIRIWVMGQAAAISNTPVWNIDGTVKNPDDLMLTYLDAGSLSSGIRPNRIAFGRPAFTLRKQCYDAQNIFGVGGVAGDRTIDQIAATLGLQKGMIYDAIYQSATSTKSWVSGTTVLLFNAQDGIGKDDPSNMKRFYSPTESGGPRRVYTEVHAKYTDISVEHYSLAVVTSALGMQEVSPTSS